MHLTTSVTRPQPQSGLLFLFLLCLTQCSNKTGTNDEAVRAVLDHQVAAWNAGNIEAFMEGYWKSDSVQFIGSEVVTGWSATMARYKRSYPNRDAMGTLRFEIISIRSIDPEACLVTGKFFLTRKQDNPHGIFTLLFRKIDGAWVIISDHTS